MSIIEDAAQLVKYNSIQGNKMNDIDVVYTMWGNLHKTEGMEVGQVIFCEGGLEDWIEMFKKNPWRLFQYALDDFFTKLDIFQVSFHKQKEVRKIRVARRENVIVNRLNKTKKEVVKPDLRGQKEIRDKQERDHKKKLFQQQEAERKEEEKRRKDEAEAR